MSHSLVRQTLVLGPLTAIGPLAIDMYLPAFPTIANEFGTDVGVVQLSLVSFFVALALGQAVYGPVADVVGRKKPLYVGLVLFIAASIGCSLADRIEVLIPLRFVQGLGGCAGAVISRAAVRDLYTGQTAVRLFSLMLIVLGASPVLAPMLGSGLTAFASWRGIFWALAAAGLICLTLVAAFLPETLPPERRLASGFGPPLRSYARLLRDGRFIGTVLISGFAQGGLFAYLAGSPFVFISLFGLAPWAYSLMFASNAILLIGGAQFNVRLIARFGAERLVRGAATGYAAAGLLLVAAALAQADSLWVVYGLLLVCWASLAFVMAPSAMLALEPHGAIAGTASALMGTLQFATGALASALVSALFDGTDRPMIAVIASCGLLCMLCSRLALRRPAG